MKQIPLSSGGVAWVDEEDKLLNARENLRSVTPSQSAMNRRPGAKNRVGVKGTRWNEKRKRWEVKIGVGGKTINIGRFRTIEEAAAARLVASSQYHGEFAGELELHA